MSVKKKMSKFIKNNRLIIIVCFVLLIILIVIVATFNSISEKRQLEKRIDVILKEEIRISLDYLQRYKDYGRESDWHFAAAHLDAFETTYVSAYQTHTTKYGNNIMYIGDLALIMSSQYSQMNKYIDEIIEAVTYLNSDYSDPNGYHRIQEIHNHMHNDNWNVYRELTK